MTFAPPPSKRERLTQAARRHLRDVDFVHVYEMTSGHLPFKLVVRKGNGTPWVHHFHESELFIACKIAATHFEIGVYP